MYRFSEAATAAVAARCEFMTQAGRGGYDFFVDYCCDRAQAAERERDGGCECYLSKIKERRERVQRKGRIGR